MQPINLRDMRPVPAPKRPAFNKGGEPKNQGTAPVISAEDIAAMDAKGPYIGKTRPAVVKQPKNQIYPSVKLNPATLRDIKTSAEGIMPTRLKKYI